MRPHPKPPSSEAMRLSIIHRSAPAAESSVRSDLLLTRTMRNLAGRAGMVLLSLAAAVELARGLGPVERYKRERGRRIGPLLVYSYPIVPAAGLMRGDFTALFRYPAVAVQSLLIGCWVTEQMGPSEGPGVVSEGPQQAAASS